MTKTQARIRRLRKAIGTGPHAASFNPELHLRAVLKAIGDQAALAELGKK